ncbi:hypothetical protein DMENIID0001_083130 [Sergentomyia squamirostris]
MFASASVNAQISSRDSVVSDIEMSLIPWLQGMRNTEQKITDWKIKFGARTIYEMLRYKDPLYTWPPFLPSNEWLREFKRKLCSDNTFTSVPINPRLQVYSEENNNNASVENNREIFEKIKTWTIDKLKDVLFIAQSLKQKVLEYDPKESRSITIVENINKALQPLQQVYDTLQREDEWLTSLISATGAVASDPIYTQTTLQNYDAVGGSEFNVHAATNSDTPITVLESSDDDVMSCFDDLSFDD